MQNILADITAQNWILALFIRDDGERFLLGTGAYEFKKSLQHFQPNTYANDVVELQGTDGQLLAGQVRRTASQPFDGYIADQTINQTETESRRRAFLMFFRKKHFYTVAYILPNGTAIQRRRGYITDAPAVAEMIQRWPEYHVALNFEDPNYYEYAEDEDGNPIYAHEVELAIAGASVGGLVWDEDGVVWDGGIDWRTLQTVQGSSINLDNAIDMRAPLSSVELLGNTTQDGTPTPDAPVAVQTTTGEQVVVITGKNLFDVSETPWVSSVAYNSSGEKANWSGYYGIEEYQPVQPNTTYTFSNSTNRAIYYGLVYYDATKTKLSNITASTTEFTTPANCHFIRFAIQYGSAPTWTQLEKNSERTDFEPYQSQSYEVNLGKNLFDKDNAEIVHIYSNSSGTVANASARSIILPCQPSASYAYSNTNPTAMKADSSINFYATKPTEAGIAKIGSQVNLNQNATATFTTPAGANWMLVYYRWNASDAPSAYAGMMIELGSSATDYAPYFTPIELCKLGDYQDKIYKSGDDWFVHKEVGKYVFDGSESYSKSSNNWRCAKSFPDMVDVTIVGGAVSDHFTYWPNIVGSISQNLPDLQFGLPANKTNIDFRYDAITSADDFKTWMASHNTAFYYALATPTDTQITNQALIDQLDALTSSTLFVGENNIALVPSGGAQGELKIIYPTDYALTGGAIWAIGGSGGQNIITVDGVDSAFPVWEVVGPATNPILTNTTTGQSITWNGTVPNGQSLVVDMGEQTATMAGANVFQYIDGQWIRLDAGNNTLTYTATGATAPSILSWNGVVG